MKIVSLAFFAKIFNLNEADLTWGFAYTPQATKQLTTAIIVKKQKFYVDIEAKKLKRIYRRGLKRVELFPATLSTKKSRYRLFSQIDSERALEMTFTATTLKNLYADRCDISTLK